MAFYSIYLFFFLLTSVGENSDDLSILHGNRVLRAVLDFDFPLPLFSLSNDNKEAKLQN
jgi:hypothetical protein